jgi:hypothetical protein
MEREARRAREPRSTGGVVCCDGVKISCNWDPNRDDGTKGQDVINECIIEHEGAHHANTEDCRQVEGSYRPPFGFPDAKTQKEYDEAKRKDECEAHKKAIKCLIREGGVDQFPPGTPANQKIREKREHLWREANNKYGCNIDTNGNDRP